MKKIVLSLIIVVLAVTLFIFNLPGASSETEENIRFITSGDNGVAYLDEDGNMWSTGSLARYGEYNDQWNILLGRGSSLNFDSDEYVVDISINDISIIKTNKDKLFIVAGNNDGLVFHEITSLIEEPIVSFVASSNEVFVVGTSGVVYNVSFNEENGVEVAVAADIVVENEKIVSLALFNQYQVVLTESGKVYDLNKDSFVNVDDEIIVSIETGNDHFYLVGENGSAIYYGSYNEFNPMNLLESFLNGDAIISVASNNQYTLFLTNSGALKKIPSFYGDNIEFFYENVDGFNLLASDKIIMLTASGDNAYALSESGQLFMITSDKVSNITNDLEMIYNTDVIYEDVNDLSLSDNHFIFSSDNGQVLTLGNNDYGQLGTNNLNGDLPSDISTFLSLGDDEVVTSVETGKNVSYIVTNFGRVFSFGDGAGNNTNDNSSIPVDITSSFNLDANDRIVTITSANNHTLALSLNGRVFAFGNNTSGVLGTGDYYNENAPVDITSNLSDDKIIHVATGDYYSLTIGDSGSVYLFGINSEIPVNITDHVSLDPGDKVISGSVGSNFITLISETGRVYIIEIDNDNFIVNEITDKLLLKSDFVVQCYANSSDIYLLTNESELFKVNGDDITKLTAEYLEEDTNIIDVVLSNNYIGILYENGRVVINDVNDDKYVITKNSNELGLITYTEFEYMESNKGYGYADVYIYPKYDLKTLLKAVTINNVAYTDFIYKNGKIIVSINLDDVVTKEIFTVKLNSFTLYDNEVVNVENLNNMASTYIIPDENAPDIEYNSREHIYVEEGFGSDNLLGAKAFDDINGELEVNVEGNVDWNQVGDYQITYSATDRSGNEEVVVQTISVLNIGFARDEKELNEQFYFKHFDDLIYSPNIDLTRPHLLVNDTKMVSASYDQSTVDKDVAGTYLVPYTFEYGNNLIIVTKTVNVVHGGIMDGAIYVAPYTPSFIGEATLNGDSFTGGTTIDAYGNYDLHINFSGYEYDFNFYVVEDADNPTLIVNTDLDVVIGLGQNYTYPEVFAIDYDDGIITSNIELLTSVNINILGKQTVEYQVVDSDGNKVIFSYNIYVVDKGYLELNPGVDTIITGENWVNSGCHIVYEYPGGTVSKVIKVAFAGYVDVNLVGNYQIKYLYTDEITGVVYEVIRKISVIEDNEVKLFLKSGLDTVTVGDEWTDSGCEYIYGNNRGACLVDKNNVNTKKAGYYEVTYVIKIDGRKYFITRGITVLENGDDRP